VKGPLPPAQWVHCRGARSPTRVPSQASSLAARPRPGPARKERFGRRITLRAKGSAAKAFRVGLIWVAGTPLMRGRPFGALSVRRRFGDGDGVGGADMMIDFMSLS
jgi:hypothetical protein